MTWHGPNQAETKARKSVGGKVSSYLEVGIKDELLCGVHVGVIPSKEVSEDVSCALEEGFSRVPKLGPWLTSQLLCAFILSLEDLVACRLRIHHWLLFIENLDLR